MKLEQLSLKQKSLYAGILYIVIALIGPFGILIIPEHFETQNNINQYASEHLGLIGVWIGLDLAIIIFEVILTILLLHILTPLDKTFARWAFATRFTMIIIMFINTLFLVKVIVDSGSSAEVLMSAKAESVYIWGIFFSIHVLIIGYIALRYFSSNWKYLGFPLILGAFGYLGDSLIHIFNVESSIASNLVTLLLVFVVIGEIGMAVALIKNKVN